MIFRQLFDRESCTYTYLIGDEATRTAALIDPVLGLVDRDLDLVRELGLKVAWVFDTHVHADHITGAGAIRERVGAKTVVAALAGAACADQGVSDGDEVKLGETTFTCWATPGHTSGDMTFVLRDGPTTRAFTGDTLLVRGCGRTDFQQGDSRSLYRSVHEKIFTLPDDTLIYPAHDYFGRTVTTVAEEREFNPRLGGGRTEDEFVATMAALDLAQPAHIMAAVPANLACGDPAAAKKK